MEKTSNFSATKVAAKQYSKKNESLNALAKVLNLPQTPKSRAMIFKTIDYKHPNIENYSGKGTKLVADVLLAAKNAKLTQWADFSPFLENLKSF
jgi:hypothetical protein